MSFSLRVSTPVRPLVDLALMGLLLVIVENFARIWGPPTSRGFFCDDQTLMYPYNENTISSSLLHLLGLYLPLLSLFLVESLLCRSKGASSWSHYWPVYNVVRWFLYGYVFNDLLKSIGKQTIGRLRPHFFAACRPVFPDGTTCADVGRQGVSEYHEDYVCQPQISGASQEVLKDMLVSFPSGHSAMAFYGLVFVALHIRRRRWPLEGSLLGPVIQLVCVAVAWFVALSRVMDYKHHWSDVAAGSLLGVVAAFLAVRAAAIEESQRMSPDAPATLAGPAETKNSEESRAYPVHPDLGLVTCQSSN
ncbi:hypothetical protein KR026_000924 [Drosophila bipectinata]|nr:hypothetical protein KR026_000924 [Drosophila bipectinata]